MKKVMHLSNQLFLLLVLALGFNACESNDNKKPEYPSLKGEFVVCQGNFLKNNGAVAMYGDLATDNNIFKSVNDKDLGDVVQDFCIADTLGFVVVNNSQKVEVVRMRDFESVKTISDLSYPRYVAQATDRTVYISNGNGKSEQDEVVEFDFVSMEIVDRIKVGKGPEMLVKVGNKMYVANSGGYGTDNNVSVIDISTGEVVKTITSGYAGKAMKADKEGNLWVFCGGRVEYGPAPDFAKIQKDVPKLVKIDTKTDEVVTEIEYTGKVVGTDGSNLIAAAAKSNHIFFIADGVYKMELDATTFPTEKWEDNVYFGIDVDPSSGSVYLMDATNSKVLIVNDQDASVIETLSDTKSFPHKVVFNR